MIKGGSSREADGGETDTDREDQRRETQITAGDKRRLRFFVSVGGSEWWPFISFVCLFVC